MSNCNVEVIGLYKMQGDENIHKKRHAVYVGNKFQSTPLVTREPNVKE